MDASRLLIVGNSGSGKSWLAERLAAVAGAPAVDLDGVHWAPGGYGVAREPDLARALVREAAAGPAWIVEGVFGWLSAEAVPRATGLVWLDLPVAECLANIRRRGPRRGGDAASSAALLAWAADYPLRQTSSSAAGHEALFAAFPGGKLRLTSRGAIGRFLEAATGDAPPRD